METEPKQGKAKRMNKRMKQHVSPTETGGLSTRISRILVAAGRGIPRDQVVPPVRSGGKIV